MDSEFGRRHAQSRERTRQKGLETRVETKLARAVLGFRRGVSTREIARRLGISVIAVNRELRRLKLIPPARERLSTERRARRAGMKRVHLEHMTRRKEKREKAYTGE